MQITTRIFESLGSTNTEALENARNGAPEGLCIIARRQTAGRGRHGRSWISEQDAGLYFSIVLRPKLELRSLPLITLMAGVAVHEMLRHYGIDGDIKWVNDILVDDKKIAGILAETAETPSGLAVVVGVGVNLTSGNFPAVDNAASIESASGAMVAPVDAAEILAKSISHFYRTLTSENGPDAIVGEWKQRSSYFSGKPVRVSTGAETLTGVTDGLEPNGALRLRLPNGSLSIIQAGDVEQLRAEKGGGAGPYLA